MFVSMCTNLSSICDRLTLRLVVAARMTQLAAVHSAIDGLPRALELYEKATAINEKVLFC